MEHAVGHAAGSVIWVHAKGPHAALPKIHHTCSEATTDFFLCTSFWYYEWELFCYQYYGQF